MNTINLKRSVRIIIEQGDKKVKVMQINFTNSDLSFYTTFPYFDSYEFRCGVLTIPAEKQRVANFNTELNSNKTLSKVKFSYHQSGIVTFKTLDIDKVLLSQTQACDLSKADWEHLFTINIYNLEGFKEYTGHKKQYQDVIYQISPKRKLVRLLGYGGYDINKIISLNGQPDFTFNLTRPGIKHIFHLAMYMDHKHEETFNIEDNKSSILALVGFSGKSTTIHEDLSCLFLHANYK